MPTRVNSPETEDAIATKRKAESNAIWFGAFSAVAVLLGLLFVFTGRHLLSGAGVALYVVAPALAGAAVYVISRPKGPPGRHQRRRRRIRSKAPIATGVDRAGGITIN